MNYEEYSIYVEQFNLVKERQTNSVISDICIVLIDMCPKVESVSVKEPTHTGIVFNVNSTHRSTEFEVPLNIILSNPTIEQLSDYLTDRIISSGSRLYIFPGNTVKIKKLDLNLSEKMDDPQYEYAKLISEKVAKEIDMELMGSILKTNKTPTMTINPRENILVEDGK